MVARGFDKLLGARLGPGHGLLAALLDLDALVAVVCDLLALPLDSLLDVVDLVLEGLPVDLMLSLHACKPTLDRAIVHGHVRRRLRALRCIQLISCALNLLLGALRWRCNAASHRSIRQHRRGLDSTSATMFNWESTPCAEVLPEAIPLGAPGVFTFLGAMLTVFA